MKNRKLLKKSAAWIAFFAATLLASKTVVAQPDLVPGINYSYNPPGTNGIITSIEVDACNNTSSPAAAFDVSMYLYDQSSGNYWIIGTTRLTNGLSGNACISIYNWNININNTPGIPAGTYRLGVWVDSNEEITETNENNNAGLLSGNINYTPTSTSVNEAEWVNTVHIFPNPSDNNVNLTVSVIEQENLVINLMDINGKIVKNIAYNIIFSGLQNISFDVSEINPGIYFVQIVSNQHMYTEKIIITH